MRSPGMEATTSSDALNPLIITVPRHSPQAMKLLLEYCYTNRVIDLGHDAYVQACRTKPGKVSGPVAPYSSMRRWPKNGAPQVSFDIALAGIRLAEEAGVRRLSLMCEVAASQLVTTTNVVEALSACTTQKTQTSNPLSRLRDAAMRTVLQHGSRAAVYNMPVFREALEGRITSIIPTLLTGTVEAIKASKEKDKNGSKLSDRKRLSSAVSERLFVA